MKRLRACGEQLRHVILLAIAAAAGCGSGAESDRADDRNEMRRIALALDNFRNSFDYFPPLRDWRNLEAEPELSWRVYLLPYMEHPSLYNRLNLEEPWSSKHNSEILVDAAHPYVSAVDDSVGPSKTRFRMFSGNGTLLSGKVAGSDITDELSDTILVIQVGPDKAVQWYRHGTGIPIDSRDLIAELGEPGPRGWLVLFADASIGYLPADIDTKTLKALITINGGETVDSGGYKVDD